MTIEIIYEPCKCVFHVSKVDYKIKWRGQVECPRCEVMKDE